jgi:hypothetical protein
LRLNSLALTLVVRNKYLLINLCLLAQKDHHVIHK